MRTTIKILLSVLVMLLTFLFSSVVTAQPTSMHVLPSAAVRIVLPPLPPKPVGFPSAFPKYSKCWLTIDSKRVRRACYDKDGVRALLMVWARYELLGPFYGIAVQQQSIIVKLSQGARKLQQSNQHYKAAIQKKTETIAALQAKMKRDERRKKWDTVKTALIVTGIVVGSVAGGIVIGYAVGALQPRQ